MPLYTKTYSHKTSKNKNIIFLIIILVATVFFAVGILIMDNKINPSPINQKSEATPTPQKKSNIKPSPVNQKIIITPKPTKKINTNTCPPAVEDIDNNSYKTIQIGTQCWMKEGLRVTKNASGAAIKRYCYENNIGFCNTDGDYTTGIQLWMVPYQKGRREFVPMDGMFLKIQNGIF